MFVCLGQQILLLWKTQRLLGLHQSSRRRDRNLDLLKYRRRLIEVEEAPGEEVEALEDCDQAALPDLKAEGHADSLRLDVLWA
jgi:hypothetical protein